MTQAHSRPSLEHLRTEVGEKSQHIGASQYRRRPIKERKRTVYPDRIIRSSAL